eukprot:TRINITY_DN117_c0_g1_i1.p1 TRINITY_DN117_c0_g1~~TRINITY_DN117_c0_g1_i1.p1  ORF type:complete len:382 (+),score=119.50 TRINITY_DN117_c0_g1_i1:58-1203(+)
MSTVCIIGAGPIGLDAALRALEGGKQVTVLEKGGVVGENLRRWGAVTLFSSNKLNLSQRMRAVVGDVDDGAFPTGEEYRVAVLEKVEAHLLAKGVRIVKNCTVTNVGRIGLLKSDMANRAGCPFRVLATVSGEEQLFTPFDILVDASGCYGNFRSPGVGGIPALNEAKYRALGTIQSEIPAPGTDLTGKNIVVVGAGYSAATMLRYLEDKRYGAPASITWVTRQDRKVPYTLIESDPLPQRNELAVYANGLANRRTGTLAEVADGKLTFNTPTGETFTTPYDMLYSLVGYQPDHMITRELHNHLCYASEGPMALAAFLLHARADGGSADCLMQACGGADTMRTPEPQFYIIGSKAYSRDPTFLLKIGFEQVDQIFELIGAQ